MSESRELEDIVKSLEIRAKLINLNIKAVNKEMREFRALLKELVNNERKRRLSE